MRWDEWDWAVMTCQFKSYQLARFILNGRTSLFCWLVWILSPSEHIITQQHCQWIYIQGWCSFACQIPYPTQYTQVVGSHHKFCVCVYMCVSEILCMFVSHCVTAPSPCRWTEDCYYVKKKNGRKLWIYLL